MKPQPVLLHRQSRLQPTRRRDQLFVLDSLAAPHPVPQPIKQHRQDGRFPNRHARAMMPVALSLRGGQKHRSREDYDGRKKEPRPLELRADDSLVSRSL